MHEIKMNTLTAEQVSAAADLLMEAREGTRTLGELPESCRPRNLGDSQLIIDQLHRLRGIPAAGWKVFIPYKPMHPPVVAPIYDVLQSGGTFSQKNPPRRIEAEVVFRASSDLPGRQAPYAFEEAAAALVAAPAFEILQSRYKADPIASRWSGATPARDYQYEGMADNNTQGCFVVGAEYVDWREIDFTTLKVTVTEDGRELGSSIGGHPMQNPFLCTFAGLNFLRHRGGVSKGQIIATSSLTSFFEVPLKAIIAADFGPLGRVAASFVN